MTKLYARMQWKGVNFVPTQLKSRILLIFNILWEETDQEHPITIKKILLRLQQNGITVGRKTVADDIACLQNSGYDIICNKRQQNQYFMASRDFELPELMLMADAIQAAGFIPREKQRNLLKKIGNLSSKFQAESLIDCTDGLHDLHPANHGLYYVMDELHNAITTCKKISFQYFDYTKTKHRILKHKGHRYIVSPYDLIRNGDRYYLIGFSEKHNKVATFRVDRITGLDITEEIVMAPPLNYDVQEYRNQIFQMYGSEMVTLTLLCDHDLMGVIIDRFSIHCETALVGSNQFIATVQAAMSPTFFAWLFTFEGEIKIQSPDIAIEAYKTQLQQVQNSLTIEIKS